MCRGVTIARYDTKGKFHHDYGFKESRTRASIQTVMLYLDAPEGSDTVVYTENQPHYKKPTEEHVLDRIRPEPGMCIVFNPRITHGGDPVRLGQEKHLLRTDLMYQHSEHQAAAGESDPEPCWDNSDDGESDSGDREEQTQPSRERWLRADTE
eukprot:TRINITY_DN5773_c0_g1_i1.p1 TRINITY_DN5773_c0_g1~~TRINITY_DN5773_c0_g1_i1.p1  ORF type:complete len:153 (+),score=22.52 TRINITY_DN5773_c0_g1_i1:591-1049(+)